MRQNIISFLLGVSISINVMGGIMYFNTRSEMMNLRQDKGISQQTCSPVLARVRQAEKNEMTVKPDSMQSFSMSSAETVSPGGTKDALAVLDNDYSSVDNIYWSNDDTEENTDEDIFSDNTEKLFKERYSDNKEEEEEETEIGQNKQDDEDVVDNTEEEEKEEQNENGPFLMLGRGAVSDDSSSGSSYGLKDTGNDVYRDSVHESGRKKDGEVDRAGAENGSGGGDTSSTVYREGGSGFDNDFTDNRVSKSNTPPMLPGGIGGMKVYNSDDSGDRQTAHWESPPELPY